MRACSTLLADAIRVAAKAHFVEPSKQLKAAVDALLVKVERENDVVYHEKVGCI